MIKSTLAVAENSSSILKSNTKELNEQLINIERRQNKLKQYSRRECIESQGIPQEIIKILEKM